MILPIKFQNNVSYRILMILLFRITTSNIMLEMIRWTTIWSHFSHSCKQHDSYQINLIVKTLIPLLLYASFYDSMLYKNQHSSISACYSTLYLIKERKIPKPPPQSNTQSWIQSENYMKKVRLGDFHIDFIFSWVIFICKYGMLTW